MKKYFMKMRNKDDDDRAREVWRVSSLVVLVLNNNEEILNNFIKMYLLLSLL
jgi:hypothetical protein